MFGKPKLASALCPAPAWSAVASGAAKPGRLGIACVSSGPTPGMNPAACLAKNLPASLRFLGGLLIRSTADAATGPIPGMNLTSPVNGLAALATSFSGLSRILTKYFSEGCLINLAVDVIDLA